MKLHRLFAVVTALVFAAPDPCRALTPIQTLSHSEAEDLGVHLDAKAQGSDEVRVTLEVKKDGKLKKFQRVQLWIKDGEKILFTGPLQDDLYAAKPEHAVVAFTIDRSLLGMAELRVLMDGGTEEIGGFQRENEFGYALKLQEHAPSGLLPKAAEKNPADEGVHARGTPAGIKVQEVGSAPSPAGALATPAASAPAFAPVMERVLPSGMPCREQYFQFRSGKVFIVGNGPGTSKEEADYDERKIDEAGGADMSAGANEEQVFIAGRGCIFTRDVQDLKWNTFTAAQVVERLKYVSYVNGMVEPKTKEFPVTYLFKTARGEEGIMEVLGVVDDQRDGWIEKGMKFRYKLVQGTGTTAVAAPAKSSLVFGLDTQGLQAALEVTPGEPYKLRILVRNVSDRGISIDGAQYRQEDECLLTDAHGKPVPVTKVTHDIKIGMKGGYYSPGQVAVFESAGLCFQDSAPDLVTAKNLPASAGYVAAGPPGRYTLRVRLRLPGEDVPFAASEHVWKGVLETGPATIEVKEPAAQLGAPVADSIPSSVLGPPVECQVNDLQATHESCALSLDSGKLLPVPANITLETLGNPSAQDAAIKWARDNHADAVAFVTTSAGQVVKCGLLCPGLVVLRATSKEWDPNTATPQELKEDFEKTMHDLNFIPQIAEVTTDGQFPANYLILDTFTHRRGVLQITGVAEQPRGVKIRFRLVEGAAIKTAAPAGKTR